MPRSKKASKPAFHQIGKLEKQTEVHVICIPALKNECPKFAKQVIHFIYAKLLKMGAEPYADRVLTPEAILEVVQHTYSMETHKVVVNDTEVQMVAIQDGLDGFDDVEDPQANDFLTKDKIEDDRELSEVG
eukprot:725204-Ditylum_brightwellii.AAC.1